LAYRCYISLPISNNSISFCNPIWRLSDIAYSKTGIFGAISRESLSHLVTRSNDNINISLSKRKQLVAQPQRAEASTAKGWSCKSRTLPEQLRHIHILSLIPLPKHYRRSTQRPSSQWILDNISVKYLRSEMKCRGPEA